MQEVLISDIRANHYSDNEDFFKRLLLRPLKDGLPAGAELLRVYHYLLLNILQLTHGSRPS